MVQMKVTAAALIAAAAIAPAVATSYYADDSLATREYYDVDDLLARDYDYELEERDFYDNEDDLYVREPFMGINHLKKWWRHKKTMQQPQQSPDAPATPVEAREFDDDELFTRELEEMFVRDPFLGFNHLRKWWSNRKAAKQQDAQADPSLQAREFDEDDLFTREFEEMFERDPFLGLGTLKKWWKNRKANKQQQQQDSYGADPQAREFDDEELYTREFEDEIEVREPEADYEEVLSRYYDDLYERELASAEAELAERDFEDEETELAARDFEAEDGELVAREPGIVEWFKNLFHPKKKEEAKPKTEAAEAPEAEAREFEDIDELD